VDFGAGVIGDTIYVVGGTDGYARALNSLEAYDINTDTWRDAAKMPQPLHHMAVATDGEKLYVLGGYAGFGGRMVDSAFAYDPKSDTWAEIGRLSDFRSNASAAILFKRLYMIGGQTAAGTDGNVSVYDFERSSWDDIVKMSTPRTELQAVAASDRLYAIGGNSGSVTGSSSKTEFFEPKDQKWHSAIGMSVPRSSFAATSVGGLIYVFGGVNKDGVIDAVEVFDTERGAWSTLPLPMPTPRHGLAVVAWKNRIYVLSGGPRTGISTTDANDVLIIK
jgi:N-acetylneuraminic acid mutarotase